jgi:hypothetical protein
MRRLTDALLATVERALWLLALPLALATAATRPPAAFLRWYPRAWRERHGEEVAALVDDVLAAGRARAPIALDLARNAIAERVRTQRALHAIGMLGTGLGWTLAGAQGAAAAVLAAASVDGGWLLVTHLSSPARWLAVAAMIAAGATLVTASFGVFARSRTHARAGCRGACA